MFQSLQSLGLPKRRKCAGLLFSAMGGRGGGGPFEGVDSKAAASQCFQQVFLFRTQVSRFNFDVATQLSWEVGVCLMGQFWAMVALRGKHKESCVEFSYFATHPESQPQKGYPETDSQMRFDQTIVHLVTGGCHKRHCGDAPKWGE